MSAKTNREERLWLLRGAHQVEGWKALEADSKADRVRLVIFDRDASWALIRAEAPPSQYKGMTPESPKNGLYVSEQGYPIYVVDGREVLDPKMVIRAAGEEAEAMLEEIGDPVVVLQRLGLAY